MKEKKYLRWWAIFVLLTISFSAPVAAKDLPQAKPDKGLVIFYRLDKFAGGAIRFNLNHSEGSMGQLLRGSMLYKYLDPGEHQFWSQAISKDSITLMVEAGKVYYVQGEIIVGVIAGRPKFSQVPESQAKTDLASLK